MGRLRWAALAFASGLLITVSGCASTRDEPMFPRARGLFTSRSSKTPCCGGPVAPDCECGHAAPHYLMSSPGVAPTFIGPAPTPQMTAPPTITTVPAGQPGAFRIPDATTVPYSPTIIK